MKARWDSYIVMSIGVGMTMAFCIMLFGPQRRDLAALRASAQTMRDQLARGAASIARLSNIKDELRQADRLVADYRARITPTPDLGPFVEEVSDIASRLGLRARRIVPLAPEAQGSIAVQPIKISFESAFAESFGFLREIEGLTRAVQVTELLVERVQSDAVFPRRGELRTELTVRIFYEAS
ncbi:MAG: type 4a pilus biogenesis protein PilO [Phycisphaerae bacterium]